MRSAAVCSSLQIQTAHLSINSCDSDDNICSSECFSFCSSKRLVTLARGLSPAFLRFGGKRTDFLQFNNQKNLAKFRGPGPDYYLKNYEDGQWTRHFSRVFTGFLDVHVPPLSVFLLCLSAVRHSVNFSAMFPFPFLYCVTNLVKNNTLPHYQRQLAKRTYWQFIMALASYLETHLSSLNVGKILQTNFVSYQIKIGYIFIAPQCANCYIRINTF